MNFWTILWISFLVILFMILLILVLYYSISQSNTIDCIVPNLYRQYTMKSFSVIGLQLIKTHHFIINHDLSMNTYVDTFIDKQSSLFQSISRSYRKLDIWKQMISFVQTTHNERDEHPSYHSLFIIPDVIIFKNGNQYYNLLLQYISLFLMQKTYFQDLENQQAKEFLFTLFRKPHFPLSIPK